MNWRHGGGLPDNDPDGKLLPSWITCIQLRERTAWRGLPDDDPHGKLLPSWITCIQLRERTWGGSQFSDKLTKHNARLQHTSKTWFGKETSLVGSSLNVKRCHRLGLCIRLNTTCRFIVECALKSTRIRNFWQTRGKTRIIMFVREVTTTRHCVDLLIRQRRTTSPCLAHVSFPTTLLS